MNTDIHVQGYMVKIHPTTGHEDPKGEQMDNSTFFNLGASCGGRSTPYPGRITLGKDPVPIP